MSQSPEQRYTCRETKMKLGPIGTRVLAVALLASVASACARPLPHFSDANAFAHVSMLAGTIGSRPIGTQANKRAREYLVDQLQLFGLEVRMQETDAVRPSLGRTARVANIIATKRGTKEDAIALLAHYDSAPGSPGAADDGLGTAVCLEAARVLAARQNPNYTFVVILTDGEEAGLMGAAAIASDRLLTSQIRTFLNIEAIGSAGPSTLFESGPGNAWLTRAWAQAAPQPRGSSLHNEIYKRLPNDTDFTVLKQAGLPGLNFASFENSYGYHSERDTPDRLDRRTLLQTGANVVAIVEALDRRELGPRTTVSAEAAAVRSEDPVYFDVARRTALLYSTTTSRAIAIFALVFGLAAWLRSVSALRQVAGIWKVLLTWLWGTAGAAALVAGMLGTAWLVRAARESYHPWYASPDRFLLLLAIAGLFAGWLTIQLTRVVPDTLRPATHPLAVWSFTLPIWIALAMPLEWWLPGASYLFTIPLLAAGLLLFGLPPDRSLLIRVASLVVLVVTATLWLDNWIGTLHFVVPVFGRLSVVTPVYVYPVGLAIGGVMMLPSLLSFATGRGALRRRSGYVTAALLFALAVLGGLTYAAPAYTAERPLWRNVRYVSDLGAGQAFWEVSSNEPGLDLALNDQAPQEWKPVGDTPRTTVPLRALSGFTFRARAVRQDPAPADVMATRKTSATELALDITVTPQTEGLDVSFVMPAGLIPTTSNLAGVVRDGRWRATFVAPPPEGITLRVTFGGDAATDLAGTSVVIGTSKLPGGAGWQHLPSWLPRERSVWSGRALFITPVTTVDVSLP